MTSEARATTERQRESGALPRIKPRKTRMQRDAIKTQASTREWRHFGVQSAASTRAWRAKWQSDVRKLSVNARLAQKRSRDDEQNTLATEDDDPDDADQSVNARLGTPFQGLNPSAGLNKPALGQI